MITTAATATTVASTHSAAHIVRTRGSSAFAGGRRIPLPGGCAKLDVPAHAAGDVDRGARDVARPLAQQERDQA